MTFSNQIIAFTKSLKADWSIPPDIELLYPYDRADTLATLTSFYQKYYQDKKPRIYLFGINPGRFGAAVTGVPFTDPIRLEAVCHIPNSFHKRSELSSIFVYEFIKAFGGVDAFYQHFCITSLCPLGFTKDGKNYNYYDDRQLERAVTPHIIDHIQTLLKFPSSPTVAICMGRGKNFKYFRKLNEQHQFFDHILPLPHPRWVMQYRRKQLEFFVDQYVENLRRALDLVAIKKSQ